MKKSGFTLAEILIALTIVGVVAALVAPSLHNLLPNRDKVNFLRVYNGIATVAEEIIEDSDYYYGSSPNGLIMDFVMMWLVVIPLMALAAYVLKLAPIWVYFVMTMDELIKSPLFFMHYFKYTWLKNITREL